MFETDYLEDFEEDYVDHDVFSDDEPNPTREVNTVSRELSTAVG